MLGRQVSINSDDYQQRLSAQPLKTEDQDSSPERLSAYQQAEHYLKRCCWDAHFFPPKTYEVSQEARVYFHE